MTNRRAPNLDKLNAWVRAHPARAAALTGWGQQIVSIAGSVVTIPLILRHLGEVEAGLWFSLLGFITLFGLADFGFTPAISRQVAHSSKLNLKEGGLSSELFATSPGWAGVSEIFAASRIIFRRINFCGVVLLVLAHELFLPLTPLLPVRGAESTLAWYLLGIATLVSFQARLDQAFLDGLGFMYAGRLIAGGYQLLWNLLSVVSLLAWPSLISLASVFFVSSFAQYWAMQAALKRCAEGRLDFNATPPPGFVSRLWRTALPFGFVSSGGYLESAAQVPLLGTLLGPATVAPFYIAQRVTGTLGATIGHVITSQWPFFTQECAQGYWRRARQRMQRTMLIGLTLHCLTAGIIFFISPWVVRLWVGPNHYLDSASLFAVAVSYFLASLAALPIHFVLASGRNPFGLSTFLHGVFTILGVLVLCPRYGVMGIPLSSIAGGILTNYWFIPLHGWLVWRDLKSRDKDIATT